MCGSDLHRYRAPFNPGDTSSGFKLADEPMIAGHEPCGVVAEIGSSVSPRSSSRTASHGSSL
jgi:threonine dehydrogenase-like Zn-dependent dehydrogenase